MSLDHFIQLDEEAQRRLLSEAVCVSDRKENEFDVYLFQLDNFYVEVYYHCRLSLVSRYRPFTNTEELKPYLKNIKIKFRWRKKLK